MNVPTLEERVAKLERQMESARVDSRLIEGMVGAVLDRVDGLDGKVSGLTDRFEVLAGLVDGLDSKADVVAGNVNALTGLVVAIADHLGIDHAVGRSGDDDTDHVADDAGDAG